MSGASALDAHLAGGTTEICRCWTLTRSDGVTFGFTDHDRALRFDGVEYRPETGLSAAALMQTTGLSVDNSEAVGALSDPAITEADIAAGRFDGARIEAWLVRWSDPNHRVLQFRGALGDLTRANGAFTAELRGLAERMNVPTGRVYHRHCTAVLGDAQCGVDLSQPGFGEEVVLLRVEGGRILWVDALASYEARWFERGRCMVLDGAAHGLSGAVKSDRPDGEVRRIELWEPLRSDVATGDRVRLTAGCDKRLETCRLKFDNVLNFRGFPDIPADDWMLAHPSRVSARDGGSRR